MVAGGNLVFGNCDPIGSTDLEADGTISVTCTTGTLAWVALDEGQSPAGGSTAENPIRQMSNGADNLVYHLFSDSTRSTAWGDGAATILPITGTGTEENLPVYGTIPTGQNVPAGNYADQVTITVTF